jgi:TonB family protein
VDNNGATMRTRQFHGAMGLVVLSTLASLAHAAESTEAPPAGETVDIELFKAPMPLERGRFVYPESELQQGHEGWVQLHLMVDPQGKPYEIAVVDSSGNEMFERAAVKNAKEWTFQPAMLGEQPVDAGYSFKHTFRFTEPSTGANPRFVRAYKRLLKAIDAADRAGADAELAKLEVKNLYEDAYINVARYQYHLKWGTEAQQLADLERAVAREDTPLYLPKDLFIVAVRALLTLQVRAKDFANAIKTWETLQKSAPEENLDKFKQAMAQVEALRTNDASYSVDAEIDKGTSWFYMLFKNRFQIAVSSGKLAEIKLRCDKQYVFFRYEPDVQYRVSDRYGSCGLELVGDPGTKFSLIQS